MVLVALRHTGKAAIAVMIDTIGFTTASLIVVESWAKKV